MRVLGTAVLALLFVHLCITLVNLLYLRRRPPRRPAAWPGVSVLIPARDEESNIAACVLSYLGSRYPDFEVIVLDDESRDRTSAILAGLKRGRPRLRVLKGSPLPKGWVGKNWACWRLARAARHPFFLFADADTRARPGLLKELAAASLERGSDLLSGFPQEVMDNFWTALGLPYLYYIGLAAFPLAWLAKPWFPVGIANGQCLFFRRAAYRRVGGHRAVKGELVEDYRLGTAVKRLGLRLDLVDLGEFLSCRMYGSLGEIWQGFSKNLYLMAFRPWLAPLVLLAHYLLWVGPWLSLAWGLARHWPAGALALPACMVGLVLVQRLSIAAFFGQSLAMCLLHPLSVLFMDSILARSVLLRWHPQGRPWKGRRYKPAAGA